MQNAKDMAKPMSQPGPVRRTSTIELIFSVIEANVWPGASTG
jgi:hypothetical protein